MNQERTLLCDEWRERVLSAKQAYIEAKLAVAAAEWDHSHMPIQDSGFASRQALEAEGRTLLEYRRVLEIFHRLLLDGVRPPA